MPERQYTRLSRPNVEVDSPLIDCRLVDLSPAGLGIETDVGLRLGVPYPFRLRDGAQTLATEAVVRWCRLVRNEPFEGGLRPVYRAGVSFVDWLIPEPIPRGSTLEDQIDDAVDRWIELNRTTVPSPARERKIIHKAPRPSG